MARLNFRQGIVRHQTDIGGNPTFLQVSGGYVNLIVSPDPTLITFISGDADYLYTESVTINNAWGPFIAQDYWLYWDMNLITGVVTRGSTTLEPIISPSTPTSPSAGQLWFNTSTNIWSEYSGTSWAEVLRVFACKLANGNTPVSMSINAPDFKGTQVGLTTPRRIGSLVFDVSGTPLRTGVGNKFFTTEDAFVTGVSSAASLRIEPIVIQGKSSTAIAAYQVVEFFEFNEIRPATTTDQGTKALGILEEDVVANEVVSFVTAGIIFNEAWDWVAAGASVNDPIYFNSTGIIQLTPDFLDQIPVGVVIGPQEILFAPKLFPQVAVTVVQGAGVTDHGDLTGLGDDDHTQYHTNARGDARYVRLTGSTMTGSLSMSAGTDIILPDVPVNPTDAANKQYVDQVAQGLDAKGSAHQCTISNLPSTYNNGTVGFGATLTATTPGVLPPAITDNHADFSGAGGSRNRILVKSQTDAVENGIYTITDLGSGENVTEVMTLPDISDSLDGTYFTFNDVTTTYYVWYNTPAGSGDPAPGGTPIQVTISTGAVVADVTTATIAAINSSAANVTAYKDEDDEFYIVDDTTGTRTAAADGTTGFTISTTIAGTASPTSWILTRATDADNSPTNEVSGGMFIFVEDGQTCAGTGWVLVKPIGEVTIGTHELVFTQFSSAPTGPESRIQDADNNTYVDVEFTADGNNITMQCGPRDLVDSGSNVTINAGSATISSGFSGGDIIINAGDADTSAVTPANGGIFHVTSGLASGGSNDGKTGDIILEIPDNPGAAESGNITLTAGDTTANKGGSIILRPGAHTTKSAGVRLVGSTALPGLIESSFLFVPKANSTTTGFGIGFQPPSTVTADTIWTLPATDGLSGQVITTDGSGTLSWLTSADECTVLVSDNTNVFKERAVLELPHPYDVAMQIFGEAPAGGIVFKFIAPQEFTMFEYGHFADAETPPTAGNRVFDVQVNDVSVGTIKFQQNAGGNIWTTDFGQETEINIVQGDIIKIISPSDGDPQGSTGTGNVGLEDISISLRGHILPGNLCGTPNFVLTGPADDISTDFTISSVVGGISHFEIAAIAYGDITETGNPLTTTMYPLSEVDNGGATPGLTVDYDEGANPTVTLSRESEYATAPGTITTFDMDPSAGGYYYLIAVRGFAPGGIVTKTAFMEVAP